MRAPKRRVFFIMPMHNRACQWINIAQPNGSRNMITDGTKDSIVPLVESSSHRDRTRGESSTQGPVREPSAEAGYTILALLVTIGISMVLMAVAVPSWQYVMKDSNEQELLFRGQQIADAIQ